jgi:hypothetical protein
MHKCPRCEALVSPGATRCTACGRLVPMPHTRDDVPPIAIGRTQYLQVLVYGILISAWLLLASTALVWVYPIAFVVSLSAGWLLARLVRTDLAIWLALFAVPLLSVTWSWLMVGPDRDYGYLLHSFATGHLAAIVMALLVTKALARRHRDGA